MEEEAAALAEEIGEASLPAVPSGGQLLLPPTPILREDNWPLLTVSKGFFENLAQQRAPSTLCYGCLNTFRLLLLQVDFYLQLMLLGVRHLS